MSSGFAGNVVKLVSGSVVAQGLGLVVSPLLTRLFAPEAFGVAAFFTAISGILNVIVCLRYEFAIVLPTSDEDAVNLVGACFIAVLFVTSTCVLIIIFAGNVIGGESNMLVFKPYIWLVPIAVFISGIFTTVNYWNIRKKAFGLLSLGRITNSTTSQTSKVLAGFAGYATGGFLIGTTILGKAVASSVLAIRIWKNDRSLFKSEVRLKKLFLGAKRYKKFPLIDVWGGLLNTISWQLPALLLSVYFSPVILGFYSLGTNVIRMPMRLVGGAVAQVFYQKASDTKKNGNSAEIVESVFRRLVAISLFPMLFLTIIGEDLFSIVFGARWSEAGVYTQILAPWMFFTFISSPLATLFSVFERQGSLFIVHSLILVTRFTSLYVGYLKENVYAALFLFSFSGIFVYGGLSIWILKLVNLPLSMFFAVIFRYFIYFVPACLFVLFLKFGMNYSPISYVLISVLLIGVYESVILSADKDLKKAFSFKDRI